MNEVSFQKTGIFFTTEVLSYGEVLMRATKRSVLACLFLVVGAGFLTVACSGAGCPPPLCPFDNLTGSTGCLCPFTGEPATAGCPPPLCPFGTDTSGPCPPIMCPFGDGSSAGITMEGTTSMMLADFSASPTTGAAPLTVTFDDRSGGFPTAWAWDFGDGKTSNKQNPVHTYQQPGSYTVTLKVTRGRSDSGLRWGSSSSQTKESFIVVTGNGEATTVASAAAEPAMSTFQARPVIPLNSMVSYSGTDLIKGLQISGGMIKPGSVTGNWQSFPPNISGHNPVFSITERTSGLITKYQASIGTDTGFSISELDSPLDLVPPQGKINDFDVAGHLAAIRAAGM